MSAERGYGDGMSTDKYEEMAARMRASGMVVDVQTMTEKEERILREHKERGPGKTFTTLEINREWAKRHPEEAKGKACSLTVDGESHVPCGLHYGHDGDCDRPTDPDQACLGCGDPSMLTVSS